MLWKVPIDQVSLSWGRAWRAFFGLCWAEVWVPGWEEVPRAPPGSAPISPGCCGIGRSTAQWRWALPNPLILELLGSSVDLTSARPVSSGSAVSFREQLRSGSSSCCVWPYKPPCCCNVRGDDLLLLLLPLFYPSPAAVQIILLVSAEELLLSGLEMPSKLRKWEKGHIQLLLTWKQIFGTAASWVAVWY